MDYATLNTFIQNYKLAREGLTKTEVYELYKLVQEIKQQNFQYSSDLSRYISKNKLGHKYPHISGVVTMRSAGNEWKFNGGFPSKIYRLVCTILDLRNYGTKARAVGFKSYASMSF